MSNRLSITDPRTQYPQPPFPRQPQPVPGKASKMEPTPDHGETSYQGSGKLEGRKALVTGGDSGIGGAAAIAYAREGADVAISYLPDEQKDAEAIAHWIDAAGRTALLIPGDISDPAHASHMIERTVDKLGGLDILVNNAAYQKYFDRFEDITLEEWQKTFDTNVHAVFNLIRLAVPHLKPGSSIINTVSYTHLTLPTKA